MPPLSGKDTALYGGVKQRQLKGKEISINNKSKFTSTLGSLISGAKSKEKGKPERPKNRDKKDDIFTTHNKGVNKRALKDLDDSTKQKHRGRTEDEKADDQAGERKRQRIMEEKARKYRALKRGDMDDKDGIYNVDFDTKWAEAEEKGEVHSDTDDESDDGVLVEYIDELGRTRKGTWREAQKAARLKEREAENAVPEDIIYGDVVQTEAWNPDEALFQKMSVLRKKVDEPDAPPPDVHYDGRQEMRTRGAGFMQFSRDEEERKEQMANLEKERLATEKARTDQQQERKEQAVSGKERAATEKARADHEEERKEHKADLGKERTGTGKVQAEQEKERKREQEVEDILRAVERDMYGE
ncbi:hypothetical protein P154DRAFT_206429 [Amniculicola lignicola CBS 123094]|uniref:Uncharacterized protein n=1 Tax=Amniculicola lignicola CBS 123094 TaxID=1392246 RepID=A0A6A5WEX7_9PLEO|nr:hypothetical protein P154DRAFT_206429 [Amniculicola lignicola CBS 123094]